MKNSHGRQRGGALEKLIDRDYELRTNPSAEPEQKKVLNGVRIEATFRPQTKVQKKDFKVFLLESAKRLQNRLGRAIKEKKGIKWNLVLDSKMSQVMKNQENPRVLTPHFTAGPDTSTSGSDVMRQIRMAYERLEDQMSNFTQLASG